MKKSIKKILVLACVAVLAVSSMTAMAAEPRATICPNCMNASVTPRSIVTDYPTATYKTACEKNNALKDTIEQYERYTEYRCNDCNTFIDSVFAGTVDKRICNH